MCGKCRASPPPWDSFAFYGPYHGLLGDLIRDYKFNSRLGLTRLLSSLVIYTAKEGGLAPEVIAPVPLHRRRLRERGFNQSLELAKPLAAVLDAKLAPGALERSSFTTPQVKLKAAERKHNVKGAFAAHGPSVKGRSVLLVDDIMTTGGTLVECAKILRRAGAARVDVLVLARTE
jgi:ComF family protein